MLVFTKYLQFQSYFLHFKKNTTATWLKNKQKQLPKMKTASQTTFCVSPNNHIAWAHWRRLPQQWEGWRKVCCSPRSPWTYREWELLLGARYQVPRNPQSSFSQHSTHQNKMMGFCLWDHIQNLSCFFNTCFLPKFHIKSSGWHQDGMYCHIPAHTGYKQWDGHDGTQHNYFCLLGCSADMTAQAGLRWPRPKNRLQQWCGTWTFQSGWHSQLILSMNATCHLAVVRSKHIGLSF